MFSRQVGRPRLQQRLMPASAHLVNASKFTLLFLTSKGDFNVPFLLLRIIGTMELPPGEWIVAARTKNTEGWSHSESSLHTLKIPGGK
jgi:hypothetical protein